MKKKTLLFLAALGLVSMGFVSQNQEQKETLRLKGVIMENDYHNNITWIKSKPVSLVQKDLIVSAYSTSHIQLYFGLYMEDSVQKITPIHIVNTYRNSDWIFFDEISYLLGSRKEVRAGKGVNFKLYDGKTKTKVSNGVTERSDVVMGKSAKGFIEYIINKPTTRLEIRYRNSKENEIYDLQVHKGTKLLKKHFTTFKTAYDLVTKTYSLENDFE